MRLIAAGYPCANFANLIIYVQTMNKYMLRRYVLFVVAIFVNAFGISFITKAMLGTSPITSITYVLSMFTSLTMGQWTIIVNILFVLLELPLMRRSDLRSDLRIYLLQIPISLCFGTFIDWSMNMLEWLEPVAYASRVASLLAGCVILALGIALEVKADAAMLSGEFFVRVISRRLRKEFGFVKLGFDVSLTALACIVSLVFMSGIYGVREGTVVAALIVGPIVHFLSPYYKVFDRWIGTGGEAAAPRPVPDSGYAVITIAREYGSGGHMLGEMLAQRLGIPLYDKEFIAMAAKESGMTEEYIRNNEQSLPAAWLRRIVAHDSEGAPEHSLAPDDVLFVAENRIIQSLAEKGPCIIVGRCADFVLRDRPRTVRVFCCSDLKSACRRCIDEYGIPEADAESEIKRVNRARIAHYEYYTGERWGEPHHYDVTVNTSKVGLGDAAELVARLYGHASASEAAA